MAGMCQDNHFISLNLLSLAIQCRLMEGALKNVAHEAWCARSFSAPTISSVTCLHFGHGPIVA